MSRKRRLRRAAAKLAAHQALFAALEGALNHGKHQLAGLLFFMRM